MAKRKKLEQKLRKALRENRYFLIRRLGDEWAAIQRTAKREAIARQAKATAQIMAKSILVLAAFAGALTVAAVAPNIFAAFSRKSGHRGFYSKSEFYRATRYLRNKRFIDVREGKDGEDIITITDRGIDLALSHALDKLRIKRSPRWDGLWRVVVFDIPNTHKWTRDTLRYRLKNMGFYQMQKSVFVSAFPCEEELHFIASLLGAKSYLRIIVTDTISDDTDLREFFHMQ